MTGPNTPVRAVGQVLRAVDDNRTWLTIDGMFAPKAMSWSALRAFEWCPAQWALSKMIRLPFELPPSAAVGVAVHQILAGLNASDDLHALWVDAAVDNPTVIPYKQQVFDMVGKACGWDVARAAIAHSPNTEVKVAGTVAGITMRGVVDLVEETDGGVLASDWKTGAMQGNWSGIASNRQVVLYSMLLGDRFGPVVGARIYYLADQQTVEIDLTGDYGDYVRAEATQFVEVLAGRLIESCEAGLFEVRPGEKCLTCRWVNSCPAGARQFPNLPVPVAMSGSRSAGTLALGYAHVVEEESVEGDGGVVRRQLPVELVPAR